MATEATVTCPHCWTRSVLLLDVAGGAFQRYVEDCPTCCHPWTVRVRFADGVASVWIEAEQDL